MCVFFTKNRKKNNEFYNITSYLYNFFRLNSISVVHNWLYTLKLLFNGSLNELFLFYSNAFEF